MKTERLMYAAGAMGEASLERAAQLLRGGRLVAFPTETVYGLGALALDPEAVSKIFEAKGRPMGNPLIVHVASMEQAREVAGAWPEEAALLAARFWPGPLTLVVEKASGVPDEVTAGLGSVGIRLPSHPVARALIERVGQPLAAPSANRYTAVSPTAAEHVLKTLDGRIDAVLDGGHTPIGIESTVLALVGGEARLLRPGAVTQEEIEEVIGKVERWEGAVGEEQPRPSPGLAKRHYAPDVEVRLLGVAEFSGAASAATEAMGVIAMQPRPPGSRAAWIQLPGDPAGFARQLYGALHSLEDAKVRQLLIEMPPAGAGWDGVRDRLERAAG